MVLFIFNLKCSLLCFLCLVLCMEKKGMRIKLNLSVDLSKKNILPINYKYEFSSWFYKILSEGNEEFSSWLHDKGYENGANFFKFFTFSDVEIPRGKYKVLGDRLILKCNRLSLTFSFLAPEISSHFVTGLFKNKKFTIGDEISDAFFCVDDIQTLPMPSFYPQMNFKSKSPIVVSLPIIVKDKLQHEYISPIHVDFKRRFAENLIKKANTYYKRDLNFTPDDIDIKASDKIFEKRIFIKRGKKSETKVKGNLFHFTINAPRELIEIGYLAGFGEINSQGFGCCDVVIDK